MDTTVRHQRIFRLLHTPFNEQALGSPYLKQEPVIEKMDLVLAILRLFEEKEV